MITKIKTLLKITAVLVVIASLTGCISTSKVISDNTTDYVSFQELHEHLAKYVGKQVTVEGYVGETLAGFDSANFYDSTSNPCYMIMLTGILDINIYRGWYKITGIVESDTLYTCILDVQSAESQ